MKWYVRFQNIFFKVCKTTILVDSVDMTYTLDVGRESS